MYSKEGEKVGGIVCENESDGGVYGRKGKAQPPESNNWEGVGWRQGDATGMTNMCASKQEGVT